MQRERKSKQNLFDTFIKQNLSQSVTLQPKILSCGYVTSSKGNQPQKKF